MSVQIIESGRLVGWKAARSMTTALVLDALNWPPGPGATPAWTGSFVIRMRDRNIRLCSTPTGSTRWVPLPPSGRSATAMTTPWPNRSWGSSRPSSTGTLPHLATNGGPWKGLDDLEIATCAWVSWFNEERLHSELDDRTPEEFEAEYRHKSQPDAA